mmetsp:Transcript_89843/g.254587  ORF Transcript_89843/g.254587 Transcript_89843/m.254587 type:complete len:534 (-) Transcript_89843:558-2159(-)
MKKCREGASRRGKSHEVFPPGVDRRVLGPLLLLARHEVCEQRRQLLAHDHLDRPEVLHLGHHLVALVRDGHPPLGWARALLPLHPQPGGVLLLFQVQLLHDGPLRVAADLGGLDAVAGLCQGAGRSLDAPESAALAEVAELRQQADRLAVVLRQVAKLLAYLSVPHREDHLLLVLVELQALGLVGRDPCLARLLPVSRVVLLLQEPPYDPLRPGTPVLLGHLRRQRRSVLLDLRVVAAGLDGVPEFLELDFREELGAFADLQHVLDPIGDVMLVSKDGRDDGGAARAQRGLRGADSAVVHRGLALREQPLVRRGLQEEDVFLAVRLQLLGVLGAVQAAGRDARPAPEDDAAPARVLQGAHREAGHPLLGVHHHGAPAEVHGRLASLEKRYGLLVVPEEGPLAARHLALHVLGDLPAPDHLDAPLPRLDAALRPLLRRGPEGRTEGAQLDEPRLLDVEELVEGLLGSGHPEVEAALHRDIRDHLLTHFLREILRHLHVLEVPAGLHLCRHQPEGNEGLVGVDGDPLETDRLELV